MSAECGVSRLTGSDALCVELLIEEGVFARRLVRHSELYKEKGTNLVLFVFPLLAIIEHDAIVYLNKKWGCAIDPEDQKITNIRHYRKYLDGKISYEDVQERILGTLIDSKNCFNGNRIRRCLGWSTPDVGIMFHQGKAVGSTFSILNSSCGALSLPESARDDGGARTLGIEMGKAASFLVSFADVCRPEDLGSVVSFFDITANDHRFELIFERFASEMTTDQVVYCFLADLMMSINLINSLYRGEILDDLLFIKFITINMHHIFRAISGLECEVRTSSNGEVYSDNFKKFLSGIIERSDKKKLASIRPLRNAFMHYDFEKILGTEELENVRLELILDRAVNACLGVDLHGYLNWIYSLSEETAQRITNLLAFPAYNPQKNVF